jgi:hypothetical protein
MGKVLTFEDFSKSNHVGVTLEGHTPDSDIKHYMFFQNLTTIKHYLEEIMSMDKKKIDELLSDGHDWAVDHLSTSTDDIAEVTNWLRGEIEMGGDSGEIGTDFLAKFNLDTQTGDIIDTETEEIVSKGSDNKTELDMIDDEKDDDEDEKEDEGEGEEGDEE